VIVICGSWFVIRAAKDETSIATDGRNAMFLVWYAIERIVWFVTYLFMMVTQGLIYVHERLMLMRVISFMQWRSKKKED
jgi:hypothetical protein